MRHMKMKELPNSSRPYERCMREGAEHLTDAELLSIILRTGSKGENSLELAERILALNCPGEGILGLLHLSLPQLMSVKGIGKVKGVQLMCIGELSRRIWKKKHMERVMRFEEPEQVAAYYREDLRHMEQEQFFLMMFNTRQMLIGERMMSKGTVNASLAGTREIYIEALRYQAVSPILVHNHPSGDPEPSKEDILLTERVRKAGELMGIRLLDHIVIGDSAYVSMKERGLL